MKKVKLNTFYFVVLKLGFIFLLTTVCSIINKVDTSFLEHLDGGGIPELCRPLNIPEENCNDGINNDGDCDQNNNPLTDCADPDCFIVPACCEREEGKETKCNDLCDNDRDGLVDCDDEDCREDAPICRREICDDPNSIDEDRDNHSNCEDEDCKSSENCINIDNCIEGKERNFLCEDFCADSECKEKPKESPSGCLNPLNSIPEGWFRVGEDVEFNEGWLTNWGEGNYFNGMQYTKPLDLSFGAKLHFQVRLSPITQNNDDKEIGLKCSNMSVDCNEIAIVGLTNRFITSHITDLLSQLSGFYLAITDWEQLLIIYHGQVKGVIGIPRYLSPNVRENQLVYSAQYDVYVELIPGLNSLGKFGWKVKVSVPWGKDIEQCEVAKQTGISRGCPDPGTVCQVIKELNGEKQEVEVPCVVWYSEFLPNPVEQIAIYSNENISFDLTNQERRGRLFTLLGKGSRINIGYINSTLNSCTNPSFWDFEQFDKDKDIIYPEMFNYTQNGQTLITIYGVKDPSVLRHESRTNLFYMLLSIINRPISISELGINNWFFDLLKGELENDGLHFSWNRYDRDRYGAGTITPKIESTSQGIEDPNCYPQDSWTDPSNFESCKNKYSIIGVTFMTEKSDRNVSDETVYFSASKLGDDSKYRYNVYKETLEDILSENWDREIDSQIFSFPELNDISFKDPYIYTTVDSTTIFFTVIDDNDKGHICFILDNSTTTDCIFDPGMEELGGWGGNSLFSPVVKNYKGDLYIWFVAENRELMRSIFLVRNRPFVEVKNNNEGSSKDGGLDIIEDGSLDLENSDSGSSLDNIPPELRKWYFWPANPILTDNELYTLGICDDERDFYCTIDSIEVFIDEDRNILHLWLGVKKLSDPRTVIIHLTQPWKEVK